MYSALNTKQHPSFDLHSVIAKRASLAAGQKLLQQSPNCVGLQQFTLSVDPQIGAKQEDIEVITKTIELAQYEAVENTPPCSDNNHAPQISNKIPK